MKSRWFRRALALFMAVVALVAATGCTKIDGKHWRKDSGSSFVLVVSIPSQNPHSPELNNQEPWFVSAVQEAAAKWNAHPDLTVISHVENPGEATCNLWRSDPNTDWNCVEAWLNTNEHLGTHVPGSGGLAFRLADAIHYFNGGSVNPARIEIANDWSGAGANESVQRRNAVCHELGHMIGLNHADPVTGDWDSNPETPDTTIQPLGPCQPSLDASPDRDTEAPYGQEGYDWDNVGIIYDTCHNDATGPDGAGPDPTLDDVSTIGYDVCGSGFSAESQSVSDREVRRRMSEAVTQARARGDDRKSNRIPPGVKVEVVSSSWEELGVG